MTFDTRTGDEFPESVWFTAIEDGYAEASALGFTGEHREFFASGYSYARTHLPPSQSPAGEKK